MKNGDYIREMDNDRLTHFLWMWTINTLTIFMSGRMAESMNADELRKWMDSDRFLCSQTRVGDGFAYGQDFNLKEVHGHD